MKFFKIFKTKEQKFWEWFRENSDKYYNADLKNSQGLLDELSAKLKKVDEIFCFEFSNVREDGKRELVISADGKKTAFGKLIDFVGLAPKLEKWDIFSFRQRQDADDLSLRFGDIVVNFKDIYFDYNFRNEKIDLLIYLRDYDGNEKAFMGAVFIILDSVLGEYDVEMKIGHIELFKLTDKLAKDSLPLSRLPMIVDNFFA